jgi:hypothetical protein
VKQVRDLAYDVVAGWDLAPRRHRITTRIRDLKASVEELNQRNQRHNIAVVPPAGRDEEQAMLPEHDVNSAELSFQESDIIGRHAEKAELINLISRAEPEEGAQVLAPTSWRSSLNSRMNYMLSRRIGMARPLPAPFRRPPGNGGALRVVGLWCGWCTTTRCSSTSSTSARGSPCRTRSTNLKCSGGG